jgi:hypothetical protein
MRRVAVVVVAGFFLQVGLALGAGPMSGTYAGMTSQGHSIELVVRHGKVVSVSYSAYFTCTPSPIARPVQHTTATAPLTISDGKFGGKVELPVHGTSIADYTTIRGKFNGSKATGTLSEVWRAGPAKTCRSGTVAFTASPA